MSSTHVERGGDRGARLPPAVRYVLTVAAVGVSLLFVFLLQQAFEGRPPLVVLLVPAVGLAAVFGGTGPGLVATAIAAGGALAAAVSIRLEPLNIAVEVAALVVFGLGTTWLSRRAELARSITVARTAELASERGFLQSILDTAPDAIMVINGAGTVLSFSSAAQRYFGYTPDEVVGQNIKMLMPSPHHENHDAYLARYRSTGVRRIIGIGRVVAGRRKDGSTFPLELAVGEIVAPSGPYFTGFMRDLSERQAAEARLQELQSELTHISRLSAMGEMASTLAHELNQPLSAIANYVRGSKRLIERGEPDLAILGDALQKAAEQALRAGDIIRRLRDFVARGDEERTVEPVVKLVEEASALALVGAKELGVRVAVRLDPDAPAMLVDRVQIQQVLVNLIRNALDAMELSSRRELTITSRRAADDMLELAVADTGPGIDLNLASTLFQPFHTTKAHGMGVGLSICRTIVEAHGGKITVDPPAGHGATFRFTVPYAPTVDVA